MASHLIGDMSDDTIDDPLFDRCKKLRCFIYPVEKDSDDFKMIVNYQEKTYEPFKVGDIIFSVSVDNIFTIEVSACPLYDEIKKLPNKVLLWCGIRSSNLLRRTKDSCGQFARFLFQDTCLGRLLYAQMLQLTAKYGFTAADGPEGLLVMAIASLGDEVKEITCPPEDTKSLEEQQLGVKGIGRKKTDESEHFVWKDDIKVPCGRLVPSKHKNSSLEYNEYAVHNPNQVCISFLVGVKFEEQKVFSNQLLPVC